MRIGGKGSRKIGRNKEWCLRYKTEGRREKSKEKKMKKIIKRLEKRNGNKYKIIKNKVNNPKCKIKEVEILNIVRK